MTAIQSSAGKRSEHFDSTGQLYKVIFWHRMNKPTSKPGHYVIMIRITYRGNRMDLSTGYLLTPKEWEYLKSGNKLSSEIAQIRAKLYDLKNFVHANFQSHHDPIRLKNKLRAAIDIKFSRQTNFESALELFKQSWEGKYSQRLKGIMKLHLGRFDQFILEAYNCTSVDLSFLSTVTLQKYAQWLSSKLKLHSETIQKHLTTMRKLHTWAISEGFLNSQPLQPITLRKAVNATRIPFLEESEVLRLRELQTNDSSIKLCRDLFLFQCYTGLAFGDLCELRQEHLRTDANGRVWIDKNREKSGCRIIVPLNSVCKKIIEMQGSEAFRKKYSHIKSSKQNKLLIVPSNQKYNKNLHELRQLIGSRVELTSHVGRKTFACTALNVGKMSIESVAAMLGHSKITTTLKHYARVDERRINAEMIHFDFLNI
jgi:site-specific recombinase XerD